MGSGKHNNTGTKQQDGKSEENLETKEDETTIVDLSEVVGELQDDVGGLEVDTEDKPNIIEDTTDQQETVNSDKNSTENNGEVVTDVIDSKTDNDTIHRYDESRVKLVTDQIDRYLNQIDTAKQDRTITAVMKQSIININTCNIIVVLYNAYSAFTVSEIVDIIKYIKNNKYNYLREIKATNSTGSGIFTSRYKLHEAIITMILKDIKDDIIPKFVFNENNCTDIDSSIIDKISDAFLNIFTGEE